MFKLSDFLIFKRMLKLSDLKKIWGKKLEIGKYIYIYLNVLTSLSHSMTMSASFSHYKNSQFAFHFIKE